MLRVSLAVENTLRSLRDVAERERGAILTEYGILIMFIGFAAIAILFMVGREVMLLFSDANNEFTTSRNSAPPPASPPIPIP